MNKTGKYVPPKLTPVHYFEDETKEARLERQREHAKRKALSSSIIAELRDEFFDGPTEVREEYNPHKERLNKRRREREKYEEDNFVRLQVCAIEFIMDMEKRGKNSFDLNGAHLLGFDSR